MSSIRKQELQSLIHEGGYSGEKKLEKDDWILVWSGKTPGAIAVCYNPVHSPRPGAPDFMAWSETDRYYLKDTNEWQKMDPKVPLDPKAPRVKQREAVVPSVDKLIDLVVAGGLKRDKLIQPIQPIASAAPKESAASEPIYMDPASQRSAPSSLSVSPQAAAIPSAGSVVQEGKRELPPQIATALDELAGLLEKEALSYRVNSAQYRGPSWNSFRTLKENSEKFAIECDRRKRENIAWDVTELHQELSKLKKSGLAELENDKEISKLLEQLEKLYSGLKIEQEGKRSPTLSEADVKRSDPKPEPPHPVAAHSSTLPSMSHERRELPPQIATALDELARLLENEALRYRVNYAQYTGSSWGPFRELNEASEKFAIECDRRKLEKIAWDVTELHQELSKLKKSGLAELENDKEISKLLQQLEQLDPRLKAHSASSVEREGVVSPSHPPGSGQSSRFGFAKGSTSTGSLDTGPKPDLPSNKR